MRITLSILGACLCLVSTASWAQHKVSPDNSPDAVIYEDEAEARAASPAPKGTDPATYSSDPVEVRGYYERILAVWKDPLTPPKTRMRCVKWAKPWPGSKICVSWAVDEQWMYVRAILGVTWPDEAAAKAATEQCLKEAAVMAALAAILSGGAAALPAFERAMTTCLVRQLNGQVGLSVRTQSYWGPWE